MRKFIRLTSAEHQKDSALLLDVDQITAIEQVKDNGKTKTKTRIMTAGGRVWFVKEAYHTVAKRMEEIYNKLGY